MTKVTPKTKASKKQAVAERSSPGVIVLQWLTYVFWGWTVVALLWLAYIVFATFMTNDSYGDGALYAIAAALVLLPLSVICDVFYVRREPPKKAGASMVVMVIHAVLFAVLGIGSLIAAVFSVIQLYVGTGADSVSTQVWLYSFLVSAAVYALLFVRTLNPFRSLVLPKLFPALMAAVVGVFVVLGFVGPLAVQRETRDDRRIDMYLSGVQDAVNGYASDNGALPETLKDVDYSNQEAKRLVEDGLVRYEQRGSAPSKMSTNSTELRYLLCVTYTRENGNGSYSSVPRAEYNDYLETYQHPAGEVCYKLKTEVVAEAHGDETRQPANARQNI